MVIYVLVYGSKVLMVEAITESNSTCEHDWSHRHIKGIVQGKLDRYRGTKMLTQVWEDGRLSASVRRCVDGQRFPWINDSDQLTGDQDGL